MGGVGEVASEFGCGQGANGVNGVVGALLDNSQKQIDNSSGSVPDGTQSQLDSLKSLYSSS